jgi:hypothetical protein
MDDDPMINDPGKHSVKGEDTAVSLRASECAFQAVNGLNAPPRASEP